MGVPRPPIVDSPEGVEWNRDRSERFLAAEGEARSALLAIAHRLALQETIPHGVEDRPHSWWVAKRTPEIYRGLAHTLGKEADADITFGEDGGGKQWFFLRVRAYGDNHYLSVFNAEDRRRWADFVIEDFEGGREALERLWLALQDKDEVERHAIAGSRTAELLAMRSKALSAYEAEHDSTSV